MTQKDEEAPEGCLVYFGVWVRLDSVLTDLEESPKVHFR